MNPFDRASALGFPRARYLFTLDLHNFLLYPFFRFIARTYLSEGKWLKELSQLLD